MDSPGEMISLKDLFPGLSADTYKKTSEQTPRYNCIAWAAGSTTEWWWPAPFYYWPQRVPRSVTVESAVAAFGTLGYVSCENADLEDGIEKVAIYAAEGKLTHAARQLDDGRWTSKIGKRIDIDHVTLECLAGAEYGVVACFIKRRRKLGTV